MPSLRASMLSNRKSQAFSLAVGLAAAFFGLVYLRRRQSPYRGLLAIWLQALTQDHGEWFARYVIAQVQERLRELNLYHRFPAQAALRWHLKNQILPGLALYQVFLKDLGNKPAALSETEKLFRLAARKASWPAAVLQWVPRPFPVFRRVVRPLLRFGYPASGWDTRWVQNNPRHIAFDMRSCFYLDTLSSYGAPELTPLFCQTDEVMAEAFPPQIGFRRSQTLGRGGECCDFQYWDTHFAEETPAFELNQSE